jgi:hypothetical protein
MGVNVAVTGKTAIAIPDFPKLCQADPEYECPIHPPYTPEYLATVDVSPPFVDFLKSLGLIMVKA